MEEKTGEKPDNNEEGDESLIDKKIKELFD